MIHVLFHVPIVAGYTRPKPSGSWNRKFGPYGLDDEREMSDLVFVVIVIAMIFGIATLYELDTGRDVLMGLWLP